MIRFMSLTVSEVLELTNSAGSDGTSTFFIETIPKVLKEVLD